MTGPAICLGKFDALHRGHQALAERAAAQGDPLLLSFAGMAEVLGWERRDPLVAVGDRPRVLSLWSDAIGRRVGECALPFAQVRDLDLAGFCRLVEARFAPAALVVGHDFRGGRDRTGGPAELAAAARVPVAVVDALADAAGPVSSTRIREALLAGDVAAGAALLGRPHRLLAMVVRGDGRGRTIGVPTANLGERANLAPGPGVFAARAILAGRTWPAAVNIGHLPTIGGNRPLTVEAHLIGFTGDCYGQKIAVDFLSRLRDEQRFPTLDALKRQLAADIAAAATA